MSCLPRLRPQKFYDIVVQVAIIRPGPIVATWFILLNRRLGREEPACLHPSLEPGVEAHAGSAAVSGTVAAHRDDLRELQRREAEDLRRAMVSSAPKRAWVRSTSSCGEAWSVTESPARLRIRSCRRSLHSRCTGSRITRRQLCADRLRKRLFEVPLSCRVHRRDPEQSTDGFLSAGYDHHRRTTPWSEDQPIDITCSDWECTIEEGDGVGCQVTGSGVSDGVG